MHLVSCHSLATPVLSPKICILITNVDAFILILIQLSKSVQKIASIHCWTLWYIAAVSARLSTSLLLTTPACIDTKKNAVPHNESLQKFNTMWNLHQLSRPCSKNHQVCKHWYCFTSKTKAVLLLPSIFILLCCLSSSFSPTLLF